MIGAFCPHCGSSRTVRDGTYAVQVPYVADGEIRRRPGSAIRVSCKACHRTGVLDDPADRTARTKVREHVVERALSLGQAECARVTGLPRSAVQRYLAEWSAHREPDVELAAPDFLLVVPAQVSGHERTMVVDVDRESLVEFLPGPHKVAGWLVQPGRLPALRVCIPPDPRLRDIVARSLPNATVMVAPSAAARSLGTATLHALKGLRRRGRNRGSNGFPSDEEFLRGPSAGSAEGWPLPVARLSSCLRAGLALLRARTRAGFEEIWPEFEIAASGDESRGLRTFLRGWRREILSGIEHRFVDTVVRLAERVASAIGAMRPPLGFGDTRRLVLLRDFVRRIEPAVPGAGPGSTVSVGRALGGLPEMLVGNSGIAVTP